MRTALSRLELFEPRSLGEALRMLRKEESLLPIAGCTDVYVGLQFGTLATRRFLNLWHLNELREIARRGPVLSIGALATFTQVIRSPLVGRWLPMLSAAAREIGGPQIQNRGTIGGNIANASPAGDTLPVFAAAEATVVLASIDGRRRVAFGDFFTGYRKTVMRHDELIVAVEVPRVVGKQWFRKVGTRRAQAISKIVVAAVRAPRPRIAIGSVAPTVVRLPKTEEALMSGCSMAEAQQLLDGEIAPIDDIRSTSEYRRRVAANLLARFWTQTG